MYTDHASVHSRHKNIKIRNPPLLDKGLKGTTVNLKIRSTAPQKVFDNLICKIFCCQLYTA